MEQKYRNHGTKKRNEATGRKKLNLNTEQKIEIVEHKKEQG
jgi:hypothetical protein